MLIDTGYTEFAYIAHHNHLNTQRNRIVVPDLGDDCLEFVKKFFSFFFFLEEKRLDFGIPEAER